MGDAGASRLLEADIAAKTYRRPDGTATEAVRGLRLAVARGEFLCLIGPSGCGKTTSLRILAGLDADFEGTLTPAPAQLAVCVVFQEPRLLPWRTVEQNVRLALPAPERGRDLDALFADLGLSDLRARYPAELSLGLARRVSLARALAGQPDLLILDEPFVSLDERAAEDLRGHVLAARARAGMSVVMVTHNLREAIALGDRLVFLAPRPTHVLGEERIDLPPAARNAAWVEDRRHALLARFPALKAA